MDSLDHDELDAGSGALAWGVEIQLDGPGKSFFRSARRVILDDVSAQIQLADGGYEAYPIGKVRKILSMRVVVRPSYTDEESTPDEIY